VDAKATFDKLTKIAEGAASLGCVSKVSWLSTARRSP
jgi:hypothetical protein